MTTTFIIRLRLAVDQSFVLAEVLEEQLRDFGFSLHFLLVDLQFVLRGAMSLESAEDSKIFFLLPGALRQLCEDILKLLAECLFELVLAEQKQYLFIFHVVQVFTLFFPFDMLLINELAKFACLISLRALQELAQLPMFVSCIPAIIVGLCTFLDVNHAKVCEELLVGAFTIT